MHNYYLICNCITYLVSKKAITFREIVLSCRTLFGHGTLFVTTLAHDLFEKCNELS